VGLGLTVDVKDVAMSELGWVFNLRVKVFKSKHLDPNRSICATL
jgi:hypothetical protein